MPNPVWPPSLPQNFFIGASFQRRTGFAQFSVDAGPSMRRRIAGNVSTDVRVPMILRAAEMVDFDEFYIETLLDGSLPFDWIHPVTGTTATYRFGAYPSFSILVSAEGNIFQTTMQLELIATVDL